MKKASILAAFAFYLGILVISMPATFMGDALSRASGGKIVLSDAKGTVWKGTGFLADSNTLLTKIDWTLSFSDILLGKIHFKLALNDSPADIIFSFGKIEIQHLALDLPASILGLSSKTLEAMQPGGHLNLHAEKLVLSDKIEGQIDATWQDASSALSQIKPLGSYKMSGHGTPSGLNISIQALNGPLYLDGTGLWNAKRGLNFTVTAKTDKKEELSGFLRMLGKDAGNGTYLVELK